MDIIFWRSGRIMRQTEQQVTQIHQPLAWPVPNACVQSYHPGSGSHRQLFHPYQGSSAWHGRRTYERAKSCLLLLFRGRPTQRSAMLCCPSTHKTQTQDHNTVLRQLYIKSRLRMGARANIAGVMSHVRHPLLNYTTSSLSTAHKDKLKNAGGLTKLTNYSATAKRPH